ncbi:MULTISPECIES: hypothetical protein [unclassified Aeromicrobium]|uniref:hypothetical protein n=1 Tax=unclassified Aeromicrobium TaxID=2633570 RepID=UPI00288C386D|nr:MULTISPECIES: hypothetical protein [unclassified Aeromicrobium]
MSANQIRRQLEQKRRQRTDAERKAGDYRNKESKKRTDASKAREAAARSKSASTTKSKLNEAERRDREAASAGKDANAWQTRASNYAKEEHTLASKLAKAEQAEALDAEKKRQRAQQAADRQRAAERRTMEQRLARAETDVSSVRHEMRQLRAPKPEPLRVLMLGASADGDLRVGREQKRIRAAVESALHRDSIRLDVRPAATTEDLLDGLTQSRPHVIHFSGHSDHDLIEFEDEKDEPHEGVIITATAFVNALQATDEPPLLVLLNSCNSASQIDALVEGVVPFAIGMADEIDDADAINYAARFYATVANGHSIEAAHLTGRAALEFAGLEGADLPTLACASDVDPRTAVLVQPDGND